jgi:hypothetical protein
MRATTTPSAACATCYTCETGAMRPANMRGRSFDYRDERGLVFDEDLEVFTCDSPACGELRLGGERTARVDAVLERLRLARIRRRAADLPGP